MPNGTEKVSRGDVFEWLPQGDTAMVICRVNRVAADGMWADFTMTCGGSSWGKRMLLPLPKTFVRVK